MILLSVAESFSKGKQTPIWQSEKRSTLWQAENELFKSNMDALTVLSIWDTDKEERSVLILFFLFSRAEFVLLLAIGTIKKNFAVHGWQFGLSLNISGHIMEAFDKVGNGLQKRFIAFVKVKNGSFSTVKWKLTYAHSRWGRFSRLKKEKKFETFQTISASKG